MDSILVRLRNRGIKVRKTIAGELQVLPSAPLSEAEKEEIRAHKTEILAELEEEVRQAIARADEATAEILRKAPRDIPRALVSEEIEGVVFLTCRRRDGGGWTIQIPAEEYDVWHLASVLASGAPEKIAR